ncbi:MAG: DegT/DnrJ/EryC1/StrS family aminotransferase [Candidatus Freyarchaeota archaeon]
MDKLAVEGGKPVRSELLPIHVPSIGEEEINEVVRVLKSKVLVRTYGEEAATFEKELAQYFGVKHAVATNTGTSALHAAVAALGIGPGDEVIVSPIGFVTATTCVLYQNAVPVFADVEPETGMIDPEDVKKKITERTKAIIVIHLAGHPANLDPLKEIAEEKGLVLIEDGAQAIGAEYKGRKVGTVGDVGCFSLHQSKVITTGEGGFVLTNDDELAEKIFSITNFGRPLDEPHRHIYLRMGYNYRMGEMEAAIGRVQLRKIDKLIKKRREHAKYLSESLSDLDGNEIELTKEPSWGKSVWWLYTLKLGDELKVDRKKFVLTLLFEGIGSGFFDVPDNLHSFYLEKKVYGETNCPFNCQYYKGTVDYKTMCPNAEEVVERSVAISGCYPDLSKQDLDDIVTATRKVINAYKEE